MNKVKSIDIELLRNNHIESKHEVLITTDKDQDGFEFTSQNIIGSEGDFENPYHIACCPPVGATSDISCSS